MCLAIPAQVSEILDCQRLAMVDILGVRRKVSVDLLVDDPPVAGEWVLVHVGFAMSKISADQAEQQLAALAQLGEAMAAAEEITAGEQGDEEPSGFRPPASWSEP